MLENYYENLYKDQLVMGIDEVGRGPLCGPEVVACCILPKDYNNDLINDSKKLSEKKRELLFKEIINNAIYYSFEIMSPELIDKYNIYDSTKIAMTNLYKKGNLKFNNLITITDAMPLEKIDNHEVFSIIKGDAKSINIAAASILAKVVRDHIMKGYDILYPQYEYNKHKGYPTKRHLELMDQYGITKIYRLSYKPCKKFL